MLEIFGFVDLVDRLVEHIEAEKERLSRQDNETFTDEVNNLRL